jgi:hypothetical protein
MPTNALGHLEAFFKALSGGSWPDRFEDHPFSRLYQHELRGDVAMGPAAGTGQGTKSRAPDADLEERLGGLEERLRRVEAGLPIREAALAPAGPSELGSIAASLARIADALSPGQPAVVGTPYVAGRLGCTTVWVAEMARKGEVPRGCVVPGTGSGKPWKFYRAKIDDWLASR